MAVGFWVKSYFLFSVFVLHLLPAGSAGISSGVFVSRNGKKMQSRTR